MTKEAMALCKVLDATLDGQGWDTRTMVVFMTQTELDLLKSQWVIKDGLYDGIRIEIVNSRVVQ